MSERSATLPVFVQSTKRAVRDGQAYPQVGAKLKPSCCGPSTPHGFVGSG